MVDEKVNVSPEESKAPEAPAPTGPGDPPVSEQPAPSKLEIPAMEDAPKEYKPQPGKRHSYAAAGLLRICRKTGLTDMEEFPPKGVWV